VVVAPTEAVEMLQGTHLRPRSSDIVLQTIATPFNFPFMNKINKSDRVCPGSLF
jgi:hypothetical protein